MDIKFTTRHFYPDELRLLKTLKRQKGKLSASKIKFYHYVMAGILGIGCTWVAVTVPDSFWTFLLGTVAVFSFAFIVFMPFEVFKQKRKHSGFLQQLDAYIDRGTVETCIINSKRIAIAEEYEDEGVLYIIEYDADKLLYLWDYEYKQTKKFPCLDFEIYEAKFYKIYGRQVYSLSDRIEPVKIDKKAKWNYFSKMGVPGHMQTEDKKFDDLLLAYNNCA